MIDFNNLETSLFEIFDQVKVLLSQETWENILLNCTKNELLVFMIMYRTPDVNMSQIAEYIGVPLNTATGIVSRMEKKGMVQRIRSSHDKRVVLITLTQDGKAQIDTIIQAVMTYGQKVMTSLSAEEIALVGSIFTKVIGLLQEEPTKVVTPKAVRRITIE